MKIIYLDNNATTQVAPEVLEEMTPYFHDLYGNPSSAHTFGGQVGKKIREARESAAELLGADAQEILFTSCGSESDNAAIRSALELNPDKRHIVTSRVEHPAIKSFCEHLATVGYRVTEVPVDKEGNLDMAVYKESLTRDTAIATIMWGNNETGVIFPVEEAAELAKERGILFHTDGVQVAGKIPINLKKSRVDMLSLSGHKLHAPKGVGILYIRKGVPFSPFIIGGHQEMGAAGGTENTAGIIGLGKACQLALANMEDENTRVRDLRDKLEQGIVNKVPKTHVNGGQCRAFAQHQQYQF